MSDTPRTDALVAEGGMRDDANFARQLERELVAAESARDEARRMISEINDENERLRAELAAAMKQRDKQIDYSIALQRAIEHHRRGVAVPPQIAANCPHHAQMLNEHLAQKEGARMPDHDNDIEELRRDLDYGASCGHKPWRLAALTALVAERDGLRKRVPLEVSDTWARRLGHKEQIINRLRCEHELKEKQNIDNGLAVVDLKRRVAELEKELLVDTSAMIAAMRKEGGGA